MKLQKILPDIIKEVVKQTLESIMIAEREVFIKEHGGTKNDFYERNLDTTLGKLENLKVPRDKKKASFANYTWIFAPFAWKKFYIRGLNLKNRKRAKRWIEKH